MADYYQNNFVRDLGEEFADPIKFNDMSNVTPEIIINNMRDICNKNKIMANFREVSVEVTFGLFDKSVFKAIEISHPAPPQSYCRQLYIIIPGGMRFFFVGYSKAFSDRNDYEEAMSGRGGTFKARIQAFAGITPDLDLYELEMSWHESIFSVFRLLLE
ncbi:MAG: hypothetical protein ACI4GW_09125 [Lachnospiraceae bacterium]